MKKKVSILVLALTIFLSVPAFAATLDSGTCGAEGSSVTWSLSSRGVLTISGQGDIADYTNSNEAPWHIYQQGGDITKVVINNGITRIGNYAFNYCVNVTTVSLPSTIKEIGNSAFYNCYSLTSISLPSGVELIGEYVFNGCKNLKKLIIPSSVLSIGKYLGDNLSEVNVDGNNANYKSIDGVLFTKDMKTLLYFPPKSSITDYTVPTGVEIIGESAFYHSEVNSIYLPDSVTITMWNAFAYSTKLTNIRLSENLQAFKGQTFSNCTSLRELYIPNSVRSMTAKSNYWEFPSCSDLNITVDNVPGCLQNAETQFVSPNVSSVTYLRELYVQDIDDCEFGDKPKPIVTERYSQTHSDITTLSEGTDYTLRYTNENSIGEGQVKITFNKSSKYGGAEEIIKSYNIKSPSLEISPIADKVFTGKPISLSVTVTNKTTNTVLIQGTDYTCSFDNNTNAGTGKVTITYIGKYANYSGEATSTEFLIKPKSAANMMVNAISDQVYTGQAIRPDIVIRDTSNN